jgi:hypothetical protein
MDLYEAFSPVVVDVEVGCEDGEGSLNVISGRHDDEKRSRRWPKRGKARRRELINLLFRGDIHG